MQQQRLTAFRSGAVLARFDFVENLKVRISEGLTWSVAECIDDACSLDRSGDAYPWIWAPPNASLIAVGAMIPICYLGTRKRASANEEHSRGARFASRALRAGHPLAPDVSVAGEATEPLLRKFANLRRMEIGLAWTSLSRPRAARSADRDTILSPRPLQNVRRQVERDLEELRVDPRFGWTAR